MKLLLTLVAAMALVVVACTPPTQSPPDPGPDLCAPGTFSATGEEPCTSAPAGTYVDTEGATEAVDCDLGKYQDEEGQTSCKDAEPGSFVDVTGATAATQCPLGRYQPDAGQASCLLALIGTYVDTTGATAAMNCPTDETTDVTGSTALSDCYVPGAVLAIAYSNLDGNPGFTPGGPDQLISRLVDTNTDGVPSAGDTVEFGKYPTTVTPSGAGDFGDFQTSSLAVTSAVPPPAGASGLAGVEAAGWTHLWNDHGGPIPGGIDPPVADGYAEYSAFGAPPSVAMSDVDSDATPPEDFIDAIEVLPGTGPASDPDTEVLFVDSAAAINVGDAFLEVDVFV